MTTYAGELAEAKERAIAALRAYKRAPETKHLRALAEALIDARAHFYTDDGPDWSGKSHGYRAFVQECYSDASVAPGDRPRIQAAARWHAAKALRERLSAEELTDLGLAEAPPEERARKSRAQRSAALQALRGTDPAGFVGDDALRALEASYILLTRVRPEAVATMPPEELAEALKSLRASRRHAGRLVKAGEEASE